eukprot:scaffold205934_cov28-Tisochrysis_lutea.AAC.1
MEAKVTLDRNQLKELPEESVAMYAARFRGAYARAHHALDESLECDRFVSGIWNHALQAECRRPIMGGRWRTLEECIRFA